MIDQPGEMALQEAMERAQAHEDAALELTEQLREMMVQMEIRNAELQRAKKWNIILCIIYIISFFVMVWRTLQAQKIIDWLYDDEPADVVNWLVNL